MYAQLLTDPFEFRRVQLAVRDHPVLRHERQHDQNRSQHRQGNGRQTIPGLAHGCGLVQWTVEGTTNPGTCNWSGDDDGDDGPLYNIRVTQQLLTNSFIQTKCIDNVV